MTFPKNHENINIYIYIYQIYKPDLNTNVDSLSLWHSCRAATLFKQEHLNL